MVDLFSDTLFIVRLVTFSTLRRAPDIPHFFALTSSMDPLAVKKNHIIRQTEKHEILLCALQ